MAQAASQKGVKFQKDNYYKGKNEFAKSLQLLRKMSRINDKERLAQLEANDSSKVFNDYFGEMKVFSTQKRHILEAIEKKEQDAKDKDKRQIVDGNTSSMKPRVGDNIIRVSNKMQQLWEMFGDTEAKVNMYKIDRLKNAGFRRSVKFQ